MSILKTVVSGKKAKPPLLMFHAMHGLGKTNLPLESQNPIYIGSEENDEIEASRLPKIETWTQLKDQLKAIRDDDHDFKTIVIDTVDALEQIAQKEILSGKDAGKTMATAMGGYGKAYEKMADMFIEIRDEFLVPIREKRGMVIILLCHSEKVKNEDPITVTSYDHYQTALHKKVKPVFEDWVSGIFFITHRVVRAENSSGKEYAEGDGGRVIYTEERPSHIAKNRFDLDYEIDYEKKGTWKVIMDAISKHYKSGKVSQKAKEALKPEPQKIGEPEKKAAEGTESFSVSPEFADMMDAVVELLPKMPSTESEMIKLAIQRAKTEKELTRILNKMKKLAA
jgi:hypothetical protein